MKNSHWTISAKKNVLQNFVLRKMICPFWQIPLEFHLLSVARRGQCLEEWKACVCCLNDLHILVVTVT